MTATQTTQTLGLPLNPYALPATTHSYLARAAESLSEAITATDVPTRYACAHVAALRAAAALLAARAHPAPTRRRPAEERLGAAGRGRPRAGRVGHASSPRAPPSVPLPRPARPGPSPSARPTTWSATPTGSWRWSSSALGLAPHLPHAGRVVATGHLAVRSAS